MSAPTHRVVVVYSGRNLDIESLIKIAANECGLKESGSSYAFLERQLEFVGTSREQCDGFLNLLREAGIKPMRTSVGRISTVQLPEEEDDLQDAAEE